MGQIARAVARHKFRVKSTSKVLSRLTDTKLVVGRTAQTIHGLAIISAQYDCGSQP